jgi:hypothetical protein
MCHNTSRLHVIDLDSESGSENGSESGSESGTHTHTHTKKKLLCFNQGTCSPRTPGASEKSEAFLLFILLLDFIGLATKFLVLTSFEGNISKTPP